MGTKQAAMELVGRLRECLNGDGLEADDWEEATLRDEIRSVLKYASGLSDAIAKLDGKLESLRLTVEYIADRVGPWKAKTTPRPKKQKARSKK